MVFVCVCMFFTVIIHTSNVYVNVCTSLMSVEKKKNKKKNKSNGNRSNAKRAK